MKGAKQINTECIYKEKKKEKPQVVKNLNEKDVPIVIIFFF